MSFEFELAVVTGVDVLLFDVAFGGLNKTDKRRVRIACDFASFCGIECCGEDISVVVTAAAITVAVEGDFCAYF